MNFKKLLDSPSFRFVMYFTVACGNIGILWFMILIWGMDCIELKLTEDIQLQAIISFLLLFLIFPSFFISRYLSKKKPIHHKKTINQFIYAVIFTIGISSYKYGQYSLRIVRNHIIHKELRKKLCSKISDPNYLAYGIQVENVNLKEYHLINQSVKLKIDIPTEADSISFFYSYDGFLPDYTLSVSYRIPQQIEIDTFSEGEENQWNREQSYEIKGNYKFVYFHSGSM